jgi:carboxypeptidase C (cathepsin A)
MASHLRHRCMFALVAIVAGGWGPCWAEDARAGKREDERAGSSRGLPAEVVTSHTIALDGRKVAFTARAGAVQLRDAQTDAPQAEVAYVSYERSGADSPTRPVAFVFNGGPGAASAWLGLGALSPWRLPMANAPSPSASPITVENAESWLTFADLVFIDPPGAGYSKIIGDSEDLRKRFFSVQGDADALAVVIRKWLTTHRRLASPKYLVGESYGSFRAVKLVRALRARESVGVTGLVLISPVLDFSWLEEARNLLSYPAYLPSFAAVARGAKDRAALADVEAYASGAYLTDLLKGVRDADALSRLSATVAKFTGLDSRTVSQLGGRVSVKTFSRERDRDGQRVLSAYDGDVAGFDPAPFSQESDWADPVLEALRAPLGAAMSRIVTEKLEWPINDARYEILNTQAAHRWDYGRGGRVNAEAVSDLRDALALDPRLKVLVVHGITDLVTPYFATKLLLDQLPAFGDWSRLQLVVLPGGHMPYLRDESRRALRDAAQTFVERN